MITNVRHRAVELFENLSVTTNEFDVGLESFWARTSLGYYFRAWFSGLISENHARKSYLFSRSRKYTVLCPQTSHNEQRKYTKRADSSESEVLRLSRSSSGGLCSTAIFEISKSAKSVFVRHFLFVLTQNILVKRTTTTYMYKHFVFLSSLILHCKQIHSRSSSHYTRMRCRPHWLPGR